MKDKNGRKLHRIFCKRCGKPRWVSCQNWKQVKYCKSCQYDVRREYNSAYVKVWRAKKLKLKKKNEK